MLEKQSTADYAFLKKRLVAIGNDGIRTRLMARMEQLNQRYADCIHKTSLLKLAIKDETEPDDIAEHENAINFIEEKLMKPIVNDYNRLWELLKYFQEASK